MRVGIDFGTTNSSAALVLGKIVEAVKNPFAMQFGYSFPSSFCVDKDGEVLLADLAEQEMGDSPRGYKRSVKRDLGQKEPYTLNGRKFLPEELIVEFLAMLKGEAEKRISTSLSAAVITVPATYDSEQLLLMEQAAQAAGFKSVMSVAEPIAAAIYYDQVNKEKYQLKNGDYLLVYDFGGGTFDASLVRRNGLNYEFLHNEGETVGGEDIDKMIYDDWLKTARQVFRDMLSEELYVDISNKNAARRNQIDVLRMCRDLKHRLSSMAEVRASLPVNTGRAQELEQYTLQRQKFQTMIQPSIELTLKCCDKLFEKVGVQQQDVHRVLMVGGTCRIPAVQESLERKFDKDRVFRVDEPELAVCMGAAQCGDALERAERFLAEVDALGQSKSFRDVLTNNLPELFQSLSLSLAENIGAHALVSPLRNWRDSEIATLSLMEDKVKKLAVAWISGPEGRAAVQKICGTWIEVQIPKFASLTNSLCNKYQISQDILRMPNEISRLEPGKTADKPLDDLGLDSRVLSQLINPIIWTVMVAIGALLGFSGALAVVLVLVLVYRKVAVDRLKVWDMPGWMRERLLSYKKIDKMVQKMQPKLAQSLQEELSKNNQLVETFTSDVQRTLREVLLRQAGEHARFIWLHPVVDEL